MATNGDNAYEYAISKDRRPEETNEKAYENTYTTCDKRKSASSLDNAPKGSSKSQTVIKIVILSIVLVLLFGLALCGVLLVLQEKLRLDKIANESLAIRIDIEREQAEANATWTQKISEVELEMKKNFLELQEMFVVEQAQLNLANQKLKEDLSQLKTTLEANITQYTEDLKTMIRESESAQAELGKDINFLLSLHGWNKASNGFYYGIFEDRQTYGNARSQCQNRGARLVSTGLRDAIVRRELVELVKAKGNSVWIGANDMTTEGIFVWEDGVTSNGTDIDWMAGQPDNARETEDCLHYLESAWKVNDEQCHAIYMYMCEKEV